MMLEELRQHLQSIERSAAAAREFAADHTLADQYNHVDSIRGSLTSVERLLDARLVAAHDGG